MPSGRIPGFCQRSDLAFADPILLQPLCSFCTFLWRQSPSRPRFQYPGHFLKVPHIEDNVAAIIGFLNNFGEWQRFERVGNRPRMTCAGCQITATPRADVAVTARYDHQPRILRSGILAVFGVIGFLVADSVLLSKFPLQIHAIHGTSPVGKRNTPTDWTTDSSSGCQPLSRKESGCGCGNPGAWHLPGKVQLVSS